MSRMLLGDRTEKEGTRKGIPCVQNVPTLEIFPQAQPEKKWANGGSYTVWVRCGYGNNVKWQSCVISAI